MNIAILFKDKGTLTLCGLDDFDDTVETIDNPAVVTLCRYHPKNWRGETYHHFLSFQRNTPHEDWIAAAEKVMLLLGQKRNVLLHCIHGRDRTGTIAYIVLRLYDFDHVNACSVLRNARPSMGRVWKSLLEERLRFHEMIIEKMD